MIRRLILTAVIVVFVLALMAIGSIYWFLSGDGLRLAIERQAGVWLGQPVHIRAARAQFFPRTGIQLDRVEIGEPARVTLADVEVSTAARALLQKRIVEAAIRISDSHIELPLPFSLPTSNSSQSETGSETTAQARIESIRSIVLDGVTVRSRGREIRVSADSTLIGSRLELRRFVAESGRTSIRAEGIFELEPRIDGKLRVNANRLDLDELLALADAFTPPTTSSSPKAALPPRIAARISAETGTAGLVNVSQLAADVEVEGDRVALSPLTFQMFGGRYQGSLQATLGDTLAATLRSRILDIDTAKLAAFGNAADTVTGRLSGAGTFTGAGRDIAEILRTARGSGSMEIVDGTIRRLNLVRTIVVFFGRPAADAPAANDRFERVDLRFTLAQQVFRAEAFSLRSADADIVGAGTLNVPTKELDGTADLSLSEALSAQAGTDLYRYTREGKRLVLPANIGGTLMGPRVTINASAALNRGLRNEVGRRLGGLLDRLKRQPE